MISIIIDDDIILLLAKPNFSIITVPIPLKTLIMYILYFVMQPPYDFIEAEVMELLKSIFGGRHSYGT